MKWGMIRLEFGDRAEDLKEHPADGSRRVDPLIEDDEVHATRLQLRRERDQVLEGAAEAVELGDDELVAGARRDQQRLVQLWRTRYVGAYTSSVTWKAQQRRDWLSFSEGGCTGLRSRVHCYLRGLLAPALLLSSGRVRPRRYCCSSEGAADATPGHEESGSSILPTCDSCSI